MKLLICGNIQRSNILDRFGKILIGPQLSFKILSPFLKSGVAFACFSMEGKVVFEVKPLKLDKRKATTCFFSPLTKKNSYGCGSVFMA